MTVNLQSEIRRFAEFADMEENEFVKAVLLSCIYQMNFADKTLDIKPQNVSTWNGQQMENVDIDDKNVKVLKEFGLTPSQFVIANKKILFLCGDKKVIFTRSKHNENYENNGAFLTRNDEDIDLVNECDFLVVARYEQGNDEYIDTAIFDIAELQLSIDNDVIKFENNPNNAEIFVPKSGDWVKISFGSK